MKSIYYVMSVLLIMASLSCGSDSNNDKDSSSAFTADQKAVEAFNTIPSEVIAAVRDLNIYYGHTSHGSQLISGIGQLGSSYALNNLVEISTDLGSASWHTTTRTYLNNHPETEVVVWSWCGQQSSNSIQTVENYCNNMTQLEIDFPEVVFIYMTGHLRGAYSEYLYGDAENEVLQRNNGLVVDYCTDNNKWLFDFAKIECYPDGSDQQCTYHDMPVECVWQTDEGGCAHSRMPNCIRKGKAFYWLLARITGWNE